MRSSRLASRMRRNHARYRGRNDLNIVPMLDVMVILTFFLIFTAVFSKTSVLEVQLPGPQAPTERAPLSLEIVVRRDRLEVGEHGGVVLQTLPANASGASDLAGLSAFLATLKTKFPDHASATLLVAEDVDYDTIVQVMDAVRVRQTVADGKVERMSLFPQISLGDAPT